MELCVVDEALPEVAHEEEEHQEAEADSETVGEVVHPVEAEVVAVGSPGVAQGVEGSRVVVGGSGDEVEKGEKTCISFLWRSGAFESGLCITSTQMNKVISFRSDPFSLIYDEAGG